MLAPLLYYRTVIVVTTKVAASTAWVMLEITSGLLQMNAEMVRVTMLPLAVQCFYVY